MRARAVLRLNELIEGVRGESAARSKKSAHDAESGSIHAGHQPNGKDQHRGRRLADRSLVIDGRGRSVPACYATLLRGTATIFARERACGSPSETHPLRRKRRWTQALPVFVDQLGESLRRASVHMASTIRRFSEAPANTATRSFTGGRPLRKSFTTMATSSR
jgi:hypothetical protein